MIEFWDDLGSYILEKEGILFSWEEEPKGDFEGEVNKIAECYHKNLLSIVDFMHADIQEIYGHVDLEEIKEKLGRPIIDIENGQVTYCEQEFDDVHIFSFEFLDDKFTELQYFSING